MNNMEKISIDKESITDHALFHITCSNRHTLKIPAAENHEDWYMKFPGPIEFTCLKCNETIILTSADITIGSYEKEESEWRS